MSLIPYVQKMPLQQKKAGKLLLVFFALMLAFTLISRGVDTFAIATVTTMKPVEGTLTRKLTVSGTVQPLGEMAVAAPEGFLVQRLLVEEGAHVKEGDVLAELDLTFVEEKLASARRELERAQLDVALEKVKAELPEDDPLTEAELVLERAKEDLKTAEQTGSENVSRALGDLSQARRDLRELRDDDYEDAEIEDAKREIIRMERAAEDAYQGAERGQLAAERAIEDAERGVEEAKLEKEKTDATKAAEDQTEQLKIRLSALNIQERSAEVRRLEEVIAAEGKIIATQSGIITKLSIEPGGITGSGGAFLLGEEAMGSIFRAEAEEDVGKHLSLGDSVNMSMTGAKPVTAAITSLTPPKEKGGSYAVTVDLAGVQLDPGMTCTLTIEKKGNIKGYVVPLAALHSDNNNEKAGYLFVLREKNTTMGTQTVVEKLVVDILDQNTTAAVVSGVFTREDKIVESSSRSLTVGDRVRLEGGE